MAEQLANQLKIDINNEPAVPSIAAVFLVNFDHRKGYTLGWHKSIDDLQLEGVVEFKSLPSGLHNVEEDLVYFIHDEYAGLSAFINQPDQQSDRAARMLAVGILVPLERGRIGRSWRHAETLKELARAQIDTPTNTTALEEYWEKYRQKPEERTPQTPRNPAADDALQRPNGYTNSRSMSTGTTYISSHRSLTPHHPALTLMDSVKLFGPLIFPLYRAALLRKRILIVTDAPVEFACNLVYNLSILSSIPKPVLSVLPEADVPIIRLRPLFTVGVMDIARLEQEKAAGPSGSFIACTTDDVLASKPDLYDVLVLLPKSEARQAATQVFPRVVFSSPELTKAFPRVGIKATRRDAHRLSHLLTTLRLLEHSDVAATDSDVSSVLSASSSYSVNKEVIEPSSWSRVAYNSMVWWASAGDRRTGFGEGEESESERDQALMHGPEEENQTREVAVVGFFQRMTGTIFNTLASAIARVDGNDQSSERYRDEEEEESGTSPVVESTQEENQALLANQSEKAEVDINHEDMIEMCLDSWSASDKKFVEELVQLWWKRKAVVRPASIECCGLRIL
ncbi:hypothetical protein G647_09966 [Cladophialophora carrionii CBS 160.54]|uniref:DUF4484 domain-containing protein n=1 Tax=Cladophialophora carrionii CBS 160.54 TaxID=1279043 RepID=V9DLQ5_9EURO|nr:uncharacterized protein G647_09966 [Cladophialophora carrionii CBS 160.54]ETI27283.1 hypothetical protein G647_09966 [Cladophialophora carrionii CBS 160.54]